MRIPLKFSDWLNFGCENTANKNIGQCEVLIISYAEYVTVKYALRSCAILGNFTDNFHGDGCYPKECANLTENKDKQ